MSTFTGKRIENFFDGNVIEVNMPDYITLVQKEYGRALQCNKYIRKGNIIYTGLYYRIPNDGKTYTLKINYSDGKTLVIPDMGSMHTVKENETTRNLFDFDSFMNHSCDYNTISSFSRETEIPNRLEFDQIASKDIKEGDELTCNYLHFDYECDGHSFECQCGYEKCYRNINGFKNCTLEQQRELLPYADSIMLEIFKKDNPNILL